MTTRGLISANGTRQRWLRAGFAALLAGAVTMAAPARAADDDEALDTRLIRGLLGGLGLTNDKDSIDYRERSPLVIPPGRALPAPERSSAIGNPNWPIDPEIRQQNAAKAAERESNKVAADVVEEESRPLPPNVLNRGARRESARNRAVGSNDISGRRLTPSELGSAGGLLDYFRSKEDIAVFVGEPPRESLTAPPSGYQTPSPNQPYGVGKDALPGKSKDFREDFSTQF